MKKQHLLIGAIVIGFVYNLYISFAPTDTKEKEVLTQQEQIDKNKEFINLAPEVLDVNNDTVQSYLEELERYNQFLKEADIIIKDSLGCNCPNKTK